MHIFQLVKTLRAKINLGEWDRVRWSGQWQHKGSFFREGLSYSDVWAKNERVGAAIPRTSGEKCLRWKTQVQKLWWEGSLHLRDSKRTGPMKANSERKPRHMVVGMKATWGLWPLFQRRNRGARGELWVEEKYNASYILKWTIWPLCRDQYMGWSQAEKMSLWRAGALLKRWKVLLPYPGQGSTGGGIEKGVDSIVCATRLDVRVTRKRRVWDDSKVWVFPKCWLMIRAGWCTVHKSRPQHWRHTHTHRHTHTTFYMSVTNSHSLINTKCLTEKKHATSKSTSEQ